ncbi:BON domain-containing protein [Luminiphilus sp.]|jgi:osmotically-inducible protein OsmY|nr:BON domain-containing protein [Luminiphilus sp.]MDA8678788.1 BON domain-containing protein [Luminiphilus sp.]
MLISRLTLRPTLPLILALCAASAVLSGCGTIMSSAGAGPIEEDPGERTFAQQMADESIETKAMVNINAADEAFDQAHLSVVSYNGFVLLAGQVPSEALKTLASDVARELEAVRRIYNELEVGPATSAGTRTNDTWITTQVKSKLLASSDTPGRRVKVVTENAVVYLMGLVTAAEADRSALEAAEVKSVARVVQLFEIITTPAI